MAQPFKVGYRSIRRKNPEGTTIFVVYQPNTEVLGYFRFFLREKHVARTRLSALQCFHAVTVARSHAGIFSPCASFSFAPSSFRLGKTRSGAGKACAACSAVVSPVSTSTPNAPAC